MWSLPKVGKPEEEKGDHFGGRIRRIEFPSPDQSQPAFAESSVCDRLAFAWRSLRNRTGKETFREKGDKAGSRAGAGRFLQSGSTGKSPELRRFLAILGKCSEVSLRSRLRGGEGGIRTLDTGVSPYNGLANRRLQPPGNLEACRTTIDIKYHCHSLSRCFLHVWDPEWRKRWHCSHRVIRFSSLWSPEWLRNSL